MKKIFILFVLSTAPLQASDLNLTAIGAGDMAASQLAGPPSPVAVPVLNNKVSKLKEWTIIALINGKNNLSDDAIADINEMETVGSTSAMDIVVELGTAREKEGAPTVYNVKRYHIKKDNDPSRMTSRPIMTLPGADMGSWEHLAQFITWAKERYPAKRYIVVVWNHGSGWKSFGKPLTSQVASSPAKGISYDDESKNHITAIEMASALARTGKIDLLASDACLMQELAVNYEIRHYAEVIAGSEETEPNEGQDYSRFLKALSAKPGADAEETARMYVSAYKSYYTHTNKATTISAIRSASIDGLVSRVTALTNAMLADGDFKFARDSRRKTVKFTDPDSRDLGHFAGIVAESSANPVVRSAAAEVLSYLKKDVVVASAVTVWKEPASGMRSRQRTYEPASARDFANATGLAIYLPVVYRTSGGYEQLAFARDSSWKELIQKMKSVEADDDYWDDWGDED